MEATQATPLAQSLDDNELAMSMLIAAGGGEWRLETFIVDGAPWSKSRPRFARRTGRTYQPRDDLEAEQRTKAFLKRSSSGMFTGNVAVACVFYRPNRQRIDTDNLLKHVCDSATGVLWKDDSQVTAIIGVLELDKNNPRTVIAVGDHQSSLARGTDASYPCAVCAKPIEMAGQTKLRKTCSPDCAAQARGFKLLTLMIDCAQCGRPFKRTTSKQRFCSRPCGAASRRGVRKPTSRAFSRCKVCGKQLNHSRGGKCRSCWALGDAAVVVQPTLDLGDLE